MRLSELRLWQNRNAHRSNKHGKNWRQVVVDCGGMCLRCWSTEYLEFHEPFGEDIGWLKLQARILLCFTCHTLEHPNMMKEGEHQRKTGNNLNSDIGFEIVTVGGYVKWIEKFHLIDRFGILIPQYVGVAEEQGLPDMEITGFVSVEPPQP